jgi:hypothetical protein
LFAGFLVRRTNCGFSLGGKAEICRQKKRDFYEKPLA